MSLEDRRLSILDIVTLSVTIVITIIALSIIIMVLSPLDLIGQVRSSMPIITIIIALIIALVVIVIVAVYIPEIITRE